MSLKGSSVFSAFKNNSFDKEVSEQESNRQFKSLDNEPDSKFILNKYWSSVKLMEDAPPDIINKFNKGEYVDCKWLCLDGVDLEDCDNKIVLYLKERFSKDFEYVVYCPTFDNVRDICILFIIHTVGVFSVKYTCDTMYLSPYMIDNSKLYKSVVSRIKEYCNDLGFKELKKLN